MSQKNVREKRIYRALFAKGWTPVPFSFETMRTGPIFANSDGVMIDDDISGAIHTYIRVNIPTFDEIILMLEERQPK